MVKLKDVARVVSGSTPKTSVTEYWNGDYLWVTPAELNEDTNLVNETQRKITKLAIDDTSLKPLPLGTVLLSSRAPIGKVAIAGKTMYCNQGFKNLVCQSNLYNKYLFWFLKGKTYYLNSLGRGATFKEISKSIVEDVIIPLPPLEVQKKIAQTLDAASELISLRKKQLAELDNLIKYVFYDMFGDPVVNEKGWKQVRLGSKLNIIGGYAFRSSEFKNAGIPIIKIGNINSGNFVDKEIDFWTYDKKLDRFLLYPNDIVISLTGTVGKDDYANVCILPNKYPQYYLNQRNAKLELTQELDAIYLLNLLKDSKVKGQLTGISRGVRQANISNGDLISLLVPLPPLHLQNQFAEIVTKIEAQKALVQKALDESQYLFDSLMSQYFEA